MTGQTARLALPLLEAGQAQKELFHNEALVRLDAAVQPTVVAVGTTAPPDAPLPGQSWIVGSGATGAWQDQADTLATWTAGGWRFVVPGEGFAVWVGPLGLPARYRKGAWVVGQVIASAVFIDGRQVVGGVRPAIAEPLGGGVIDTEARAALHAILVALRQHGLIAL